MADLLEANKKLVRRLYEEGFNAGDLEAVDRLVAPDVVPHNPIILDAPTASRTASACFNSSESCPRTTTWPRRCPPPVGTD